MKSFQETNLLSCGSDLLEGFVLDILSPEGEKENGGFGRLSLQVTYIASFFLFWLELSHMATSMQNLF